MSDLYEALNPKRLVTWHVAIFLSSWIGVAHAGSLSVSPTQLVVPYPGAIATLQVTGRSEKPSSGQVRVFRWLQQDGADNLVPTRDVVASPPALRLDSGKEMTVRLVRTVKSPVVGEECYRVLVDQLPAGERDSSTVQFAIRHNIPLCFDGAKQERGAVEWSLRRDGKGLVLFGSNSGQRRVLVKDLKITGTDGALALLDYAAVLGGGQASWALKGKLKNFAPGSAFTLTATINGKAVEVKGRVGGS